MEDQIQSILENTFKLKEFRPLQSEIVHDILTGRDILVLACTGYGKSLTFQLPAVYQDGITVVISPLLSLIYDQVEGLKELGLVVAFWNSQTTMVERNSFLSTIRGADKLAEQDRCKFLYTTPETIINNKC